MHSVSCFRKGMQFLFYCCNVDGTIKSLAILTQVGEQHIWGEESKKSLRCWSTVVAKDKCLSLGKPKYLDTQKIGCNHSKIWTMWLYHRVMSKRCRRNGKQWKPWSDCFSRSSLIWVCTVCPGIPVRKLRIITVFKIVKTCSSGLIYLLLAKHSTLTEGAKYLFFYVKLYLDIFPWIW